jgi:signal transduction histidine kinase
MTVSDNGKGMEEPVKARAFEDFFTTKPRGKGSGIGLGLSRRLLRSAGGEIELDSLPGVGTVVAVRLPLSAEPQAA